MLWRALVDENRNATSIMKIVAGLDGGVESGLETARFSRGGHPSIPQGSTPLLLAAYAKRADVAELLLGAGAHVNAMVEKTALHVAALLQDLPTVQALLAHPDCDLTIDTADTCFRTAIHFAASGADAAGTRIVSLLLNRGVGANARDVCESTPLHAAAKAGNIATIAELVRFGAEVDAADNNGETSLHTSVNSTPETISALLSLGANPIAFTKKGSTPLFMAAAFHQPENVKALIAASGASIDAMNANGYTALSIAARNGSADAVELLLADGHGIHSISCSDKRSALHEAVVFGNFKTVQLLLDCGFDPSQRDGLMRTALELAVKQRNESVIRTVAAETTIARKRRSPYS